MAKHGRAADEYGNELGLHHGPEEMVEALEMLFRLHRGDLAALVPEIHYRHLRGLLAVVKNVSKNHHTPGCTGWPFMTKIGEPWDLP